MNSPTPSPSRDRLWQREAESGISPSGGRLRSSHPRSHRSWFSAAILGTCLAAGFVAAQDPIIPSSTRFLINVGGGVTVQYPYFANRDLSVTDPAVRRIVIVHHGVSHNADSYYNYAIDAMNMVPGAADETLVISPQSLRRNYPNDGVKDKFYTSYATNNLLYWTVAPFNGRTSAMYGTSETPLTLSLFEVYDRFLSDLVFSGRYPNLETVVVTGYSGGGQLTGRYAAMGDFDHEAARAIGVTVRYAPGAPSSFVYMDNKRPDPQSPGQFVVPSGSSCQSTYNNYTYGLENLTNSQYAPYFSSITASEARNKLKSRIVSYWVGENDNDPNSSTLDKSCGANLQGPDRVSRMENYFDHLQDHFGSAYRRHSFAVAPGFGHQGSAGVRSPTYRRIAFGYDPFSSDSDGIFHLWNFDDPHGTSLSNAVNSASPTTSWSGNLSNSTTTGTGVFRLRRNDSGNNRRADVGETYYAAPIYMYVELDSWQLAHASGTNPAIYFEFMNGLAAQTPSQITAGVRLVRQSNGNVTLQATANGTGATNTDPIELFTSTQTQPVALLVTYHDFLNTYSVDYKIGHGDWINLHTGDTAATRTALSYRMYVIGDFDGGGQNYLDIDRFSITRKHPSLLFGPVAHAYHLWNFDEANGTVMSETVNSASPPNSWSGNLNDSTTTGTGVFRLQRNGSAVNRRADVGQTHGASPIYLYTELEAWELSHTSGSNPSLYVEFMNGLAGTNPSQVTAGVRLVRQSNGNVSLQAVANGTAATSSSAVDVFTSTQSERVALLVSYHERKNTYSVDYRVGTGDWTNLHTGITSAFRSAESFRIRVDGDFNGGGQNFMDFGRFAVTSEHPGLMFSPEPFMFHAWRFDESNGTPLGSTVNSAAPGENWSGNLADSSATGTGLFKIRRNGSNLSRRVDLGEIHGADPIYMLVEIESWQLAHASGTQPRIEFDFMNGFASENPDQITAGVRLERLSNGKVVLEARANGTNATGSDDVDVFSTSTQTEKVDLLITYRQVSNTYAVDYRIGGGPWVNLHTGITSTVRTAKSIRMRVNGDFKGGSGSNENHLSLDSIFVTGKHPGKLTGDVF